MHYWRAETHYWRTPLRHFRAEAGSYGAEDATVRSHSDCYCPEECSSSAEYHYCTSEMHYNPPETPSNLDFTAERPKG